MTRPLSENQKAMLRKMRSEPHPKLGVYANTGNWYWTNNIAYANRATCSKLLQCGYIELHNGVYKVSAAGEAVEL